MTGTAAAPQQPRPAATESDLNEHHRNEQPADRRPRGRPAVARRPRGGPQPSPEDQDVGLRARRDAAPGALAGADPDGDEAPALAERAVRQQGDQSETPACHAGQDVSRYPAQVGSMTWHLLAGGYTITWAPTPAGCTLTLDRHGPRGGHTAYRGQGPTMQRAWDEVRAQLSHGGPHAAASGTRVASGSARGSDRLYRVVQHYDSWPFQADSRVPHGSNGRKRTDTFRTLGPVKQRLARANGHARYQRQNGGDWSGFVAVAEQLTDEGWQPIDVDFSE